MKKYARSLQPLYPPPPYRKLDKATKQVWPQQFRQEIYFDHVAGVYQEVLFKKSLWYGVNIGYISTMYEADFLKFC